MDNSTRIKEGGFTRFRVHTPVAGMMRNKQIFNNLVYSKNLI